jgi:hypothetical protein
MSRAKLVSDFLGLTKSTASLLFMAVWVGMGEGVAGRFLPIYLPAAWRRGHFDQAFKRIGKPPVGGLLTGDHEPVCAAAADPQTQLGITIHSLNSMAAF